MCVRTVTRPVCVCTPRPTRPGQCVCVCVCLCVCVYVCVFYKFVCICLLGNLLVITMVSYFGAKFHRPRIIGTGALLMSLGTFLMALPHFLMGRWVQYCCSLWYSITSGSLSLPFCAALVYSISTLQGLREKNSPYFQQMIYLSLHISCMFYI